MNIKQGIKKRSIFVADKRLLTRKFTSDYFLIYETSSNGLIGRITDLTTEGFLLVSETEIVVPLQFNCRLDFGRIIGVTSFLIFDTETRWCNYNKRCNWYEVGFRILNLTKEDRKFINEIIDDWEIKKKRERVE